MWSGGNAILMVSLGIGYLILYFAKREEKGLQVLGYFLGTLILLYSAISILLNVIGITPRASRRMMMRPPPQMMPSTPQVPPLPK
jgi:hypothetical protein